jgi:hypothetical protein
MIHYAESMWWLPVVLNRLLETIAIPVELLTTSLYEIYPLRQGRVRKSLVLKQLWSD